MCGLAVFFSSHGAAAESCEAIRASLELMHHRGPDETNVVLADAHAVIGHKRLCIVDIHGSQEPLAWSPADLPSRRYLLTFNGEIYNYRELRAELSREFGAQFSTQGDGEVILAGYHYWGEAVLDRLRGMFAFVIWDQTRQRAFAARDPFGIKPMYLLSTGDGLYLASEKKALLPFAAGPDGDGPDDDGLDERQLKYLLTYQYVPEPRTLHRAIDRLSPGECLTWAPDAQMSRRRYYRAVFAPRPVAAPQRLYAEILQVLRESVRLQLAADVPVGALLSGGIDSTSIVALAREFKPDILTFTVGFDVSGYSEVELALESARRLAVACVPTEITAQDVMTELPRIVWHLDDPIADPSLVPLYFVARKAAEHVTVVLSGEGADELFGGYAIYREPISLAPITGLPHPVQRGLRAVARVIPQGVKGRSFLERGTTPLTERFNGNARIFTRPEEISRLLRRDDGAVRSTDLTSALYAEAARLGLDDITAMQHIDVHTWLSGNSLTGADRMSMAHSLELRVPYLDRDVFAVAAGIPPELKVPARPRTTKHALRQALRQLLPPGVADRPKLGFPTPTRVWLAGEMYEWAREMLHTHGPRRLLDLSYADQLLREHRAGGVDHSRKIWTILCFCLWHGIFVDGAIDPGANRAPAARRLAEPRGSEWRSQAVGRSQTE
jgi:asparagine synthase (glutamine-hydrolysing)